MAKKKDSLCFDISSLKDEQKRTFAKNLKQTVDKFNSDLDESEPQTPKDEDLENES